MATITHDGLKLCTVCAHLVANGEFRDGTDAAEVAGAEMARRWAGAQPRAGAGRARPLLQLGL